jgi:hypothetical protein
MGNEVRQAWLSADLRRMLSAVHLKSGVVDRHFLLMAIVDQAYRRRAEPAMRAIALEAPRL